MEHALEPAQRATGDAATRNANLAKTAISRSVPPLLEGMLKLLALAVPVAYALGHLYLEGYWGALHLPTSLGSYRFDGYIFFGGCAIAFPIIDFATSDPARVAQVVMIAGMFAALMACWLLLSRKLQPLFVRFDAWIAPKARRWFQHAAVRDVTNAVSLGCAVAIALLALLLFVLSAVLGLAVALKSGQTTGENLLVELKAHPADYARVRWTESDGAVGEGLLDSCNDTWCIVFDGKQLLGRPRTSITSITAGSGR